MTPWKLAGGVLMLLAGGIGAYLSCQEEKKKLTVPDAWVELIEYTRVQIDCFLSPLDEILAGADPALLRRCGGGRAADDFRRLSSNGARYLDETCRRALGSFVQTLGSSGREEQLKRCDYALSVLRASRDRRAGELSSRTKLCATLCLCAAAGTLILLW